MRIIRQKNSDVLLRYVNLDIKIMCTSGTAHTSGDTLFTGALLLAFLALEGPVHFAIAGHVATGVH